MSRKRRLEGAALEDEKQREAQSSTPRTLTSGRVLAKNTLWNITGQGVPLIAAIFTIPLLIKGLGIDRFGVLTLAWVVIGYLSLFDLGIGRALTWAIAEKLDGAHENEIPLIAWTALLLMLLLGVFGAIVVALLSSWLIRDALKIPVILQRETADTFFVLALSIPIVISTAGLRGILEAYQRFGLANAIRVPMGVFTFLGPFLVLQFSNSLVLIGTVLVAGRLIAWFFHLVFCLRIAPGLNRKIIFRRRLLGPLFRFGGWMTITNLIGPLMMYADRFLIGALVSMAAVAYYTTPYEMVTKLLVLPAALVGVLFPAFASAMTQDKSRARKFFQRGTSYIFLAVFPLTLVIVTFAPEGLELWLGSEFSRESATVLRWLSVGVLVNSLAHIPFALVQGAGRPDLTAKLHVAELVFYVGILWWLLIRFGINGVAMAWLLRVLVDTVILFWMAHSLVPCGKFLSRMFALVGVALIVLALGATLHGAILKGAYLLGVLAIFAASAWFFILNSEERTLLVRVVSRS